jgi:NADH-ubiquinone oxidoreductase complex I, 21 kDa subunit
MEQITFVVHESIVTRFTAASTLSFFKKQEVFTESIIVLRLNMINNPTHGPHIVFPHKFPIVNPSPTVDDCFHSFRPTDYLKCFSITLASWTYGFVTGKPARFAMAGMMATIGLTFGSFVMIQDTRGRLMGFRENSREIKLFGESDIQ